MMPGQAPPQISAAPPNSGPATMPQGNPGNSAAAMLQVRNAVQMLEKALPSIPMGSPLHSKIMKVTSELVKELSQGDENQALQLQSLVQMMRSQSQQQPTAALTRMFPQTPQTPALPQAGETPPAQAAA